MHVCTFQTFQLEDEDQWTTNIENLETRTMDPVKIVLDSKPKLKMQHLKKKIKN